MDRPKYQSLADIAAMEEANLRLNEVLLYAKPFFEKRFQDALKRVVNDLGEVGIAIERLLSGEREKLVRVLRDQLSSRYTHVGDRDKPSALPDDLMQW